MSLLACVYKVEWDEESGERITEDMGFDRPIGGENWRWSFYGCEAAKSLGLTIIPSLAHGDIYARGDDLELLEKEVRLMMENLPLLVSQSEIAAYAQRLEYILEAISIAKPIEAEVYLW